MHKDADGNLWVDRDDLMRRVWRHWYEQGMQSPPKYLDPARWGYTKIGSCDDGTFESTVAMLERHAKK